MQTSKSSDPGSSGGSKRKVDSSLDQTSQFQPTPHSSSPRRPANIKTPPTDLDDARKTLLKQYGCVAEKSVSKFLDDHVPHVANAVVEQVMVKLKEEVKLRTKETSETGTRSRKTGMRSRGMKGRVTGMRGRGAGTKGRGRGAGTRSRGRGAGTRNCDLPAQSQEKYFPLTPTGQVSGYTTGSPARKKVPEVQAFGPLYDLIEAILELAAKLNGCCWVTHSTRQDHLSGEKPNSSRPDSYLHLIPSILKVLGWEQLLCTGEVKKKRTSKTELDNWAKVLWSMHHIMRNDPCRLFTFGYSMEDDQARLWYHARSGVFVSEPFNWIKDPKPLVTLILALTLVKSEHFSPVAHQDLQAREAPLCASQSQDEVTQVADESITFLDSYPTATNDSNEVDRLYANHSEYLERIGIDSKMKRVDVAGNIQYEITVAGTVFVTEEILCDFKADYATGRCTRVWVVYMKGNSDVKFVLKDVWLEKDAEVEGDKLKRLKELVDQDKQPHGIPVKDWHRDHLLHMHTDEKLGQRVLGVRGRHKAIHLNDKSWNAMSSSVHSGSQRAESRGGPSQLSPVQESYVFDAPDRFHYRIVFKGKMTRLESAPCRKAASEVAVGILRACWVFWIYRMMHRDVSSWNAYWDPKSRTGRLGDYDYLISYGIPGTGTMKTGTPHFWSIEVEQQRYMHYQEITIDQNDILAGIVSKKSEAGKQGAQSTPGEQLKPASIFQHNLLHDLESVFWVSLWTYLFLVDKDSGQNDGEDVEANEKRRQFYKETFPLGSSEAMLKRSTFLGRQAGNGNDLFRRYSPITNNEVIHRVIEQHCDNLRRGIILYFQNIEKELVSYSNTPATSIGPLIPYTHDTFNEALDTLHQGLDAFAKSMGGYDCFPVSPLSQYQYVLTSQGGPTVLQRWKDDDDDDGNDDDNDDNDDDEYYIIPSAEERERPPAGSTSFSRTSNKRRKGT
ncbi:hypothetical protein PM082_000006 [Marasmius tenuissimus]|nr:hypothetical protein PM082_000006 [Marasmius tenuissimus]